jgi:hypothetical protein
MATQAKTEPESPTFITAPIPRRLSPINQYVPQVQTMPITQPVEGWETLSQQGTPFEYAARNFSSFSHASSVHTEPVTVNKHEDSTLTAGPSKKGKKKVSPTPMLWPIILDSSFLHLDQAILESGKCLGLTEEQTFWVKDIAENVTKINIVKAYNILGDKLYKHNNAQEVVNNEFCNELFAASQHLENIFSINKAHSIWLQRLEGKDECIGEIISTFRSCLDGIENWWNLLAPRYQTLSESDLQGFLCASHKEATHCCHTS